MLVAVVVESDPAARWACSASCADAANDTVRSPTRVLALVYFPSQPEEHVSWDVLQWGWLQWVVIRQL